MNEAITVELQFFLISILWGAIILVIYDLLRILRRLIPHNSLFIALEDLIFWVLASVFIFAMIYTMNNGTIRGFSVMGMGIGMILYHYIFSELLVKWISKALLLLMRPFKMFLGQLKRVLRFLLSKTKKVARYFDRRLKKITKSVKMIMNNHKSKVTEKHRLRKEAAKERAVVRSQKRELKRSNRKRSTKRMRDMDKDRAQKEAALVTTPSIIGEKSAKGYHSNRVLRSGSIPVRKK